MPHTDFTTFTVGESMIMRLTKSEGIHRQDSTHHTEILTSMCELYTYS
jgi:hypothetical protein